MEMEDAEVEQGSNQDKWSEGTYGNDGDTDVGPGTLGSSEEQKRHSCPDSPRQEKLPTGD